MKEHQLINKVFTMKGVIAIVEDDSEISEILKIWLELQDFHANILSSGESLLQAIDQVNGGLIMRMDKTHPLSLPLLGSVLDINLPGVTGVELACHLRSLAPELPMVMITAISDEERIRLGDLPVGIQCVKKPFDLDTLAAALFPHQH